MGGPSGGESLPPRKAEIEKLVIGPLMVLGEMTTGGHYMEMVKIIKQATNKSYATIVSDLWKQEGVLGFYKGFLPWGMLQMVKGIPVLFIQAESNHRFKGMGLDNKTSETLAGFVGGVGQGVFLTPTQRLKTIVMTDPKYGGANAPKTVGQAMGSASKVIVDVVKNDGIGSLFKGLGPMMGKRGFDWGLRFYGISASTTWFKGNDPTYKLTTFEKMLTGVFGGAVSTLTMPFDSWVSNCQKANKAGDKKGAIDVAREMYRTGGSGAFVRGWLMRLCHASYHTIWMTTLGQYFFELWRKTAA
eukprot:TRINITY_DN4785_c0_g1_i1.p1 TRINITY_DN4785_c0_g1~~TRINITY_DN4785_c0_g1_i1.p1  ORF type:complete len:301 (+),score=108.57 TRINITY_DN4785_c0_g1_i1:113-1015(+)